ncbi:MAG: restriction endonuclease subunit S [Candidatus Peregrinibacteria bacterium]|nr:restriction endonuclease subunit S [Candidatus Peregrinibacteria bacterium]
MTNPIPTDWKQVKLSDVSEIKGGYAFKSALMSSEPDKYQIIKMGNVYNDKLDLSRNPSYLDEINEKECAYLLKIGDIITSLTGTIGKRDYGYIVQIKDQKNLLLNQRLALFRAKKSVLPNFLFNKTKHKEFKDKFFDISKGGTGNQSNVSTSALKELTITIPPLPEQHRIVAVLETWDKALEALTRKIECKKNIKKGLMQQLLTGQVRVAGFSGAWQTVKLGDVCEVISGGTPLTQNPSYWNGSIEWVTPTEITKLKGRYIKSSKRKITNLGLNNSSATLIKKNSLILCSRASVGVCAINKKEVTTNQGFKNIIPNPDKLNVHFIYFWALENQSCFKNIASGSTFLEFSKKDLLKLKILIPSIKEQTAIAQILTTADDEITALEKKRDILEDQKKYLLNNLITGKIRTPENLNI